MNSQRINILRESIIPDHDNIERPIKRQKSETATTTSTGTVNVVSVLADIGTTKYNLGDYHAAEECFSQALCRVDIDYLYSFVGIKVTNNNTTVNNEKTYQDDKIQNESSSSTQQKVEYDEGMRVYQRLLHIQENTSTEELAAILCYNIAQTYVQRSLHNDAILWFHKSLDKFLSLVHSSSNNKAISIVANLSSLAYCLYSTGHDDQAKTFYQRAMDVVLEHNLGAAHLAASTNSLAVILFTKQQSSDPNLVMQMFLESLNLYKSCQKNNNNSDNTILMVREIATVLNNIGRLHYLQSDFEDAFTVYKECLQLRRDSLGCDSVDVAATAYNLGQTCYQLGRLDEALTYYQDFLSIMTPVVGPTSKDIALVYKGIAEIHYDKSSFKTALQYYNKALQIQKVHSNGNPVPDVAATLNKMGNLCYGMKDFVTAMKHYQQGLQIEKAILETNHPHIIITKTNIGHIHKQLGQYRDALLTYQQVYQMQYDKFGADKFVLAETLSSIGLMQYHLKKYEASFDSYQEALRIRRQHFGSDDHPEIASTLNSIGLVLFRQEIHDLAKTCFEESLRIRSKLLGKDRRDVAILWYNIATIHFETGEDDLAIQMYKETLRVERCALGRDHPDVILTLQHLGQVHQQLGMTEKALEYFNEALNIERNRICDATTNASDNEEDDTKKQQKNRSLARILNLLGNVYLQLGRTPEMMECYIEASRIYESNRSNGETVVIGGYNFYGLSKTNPPCAPLA